MSILLRRSSAHRSRAWAAQSGQSLVACSVHARSRGLLSPSKLSWAAQCAQGLVGCSFRVCSHGLFCPAISHGLIGHCNLSWAGQSGQALVGWQTAQGLVGCPVRARVSWAVQSSKVLRIFSDSFQILVRIYSFLITETGHESYPNIKERCETVTRIRI